MALGSQGDARLPTHSCITRTSRNSPRREKRRRPAFFISFQAGSGSIAMKPSAIERQRRRATRRSWTGSGPKPAHTWSHSWSTRSIQKRRPVFLARALTVARAGLADNGDSWPLIILAGLADYF